MKVRGFKGCDSKFEVKCSNDKFHVEKYVC